MCSSAQFSREDGSGSGFGSWKTVPAVPVPRSVPGNQERKEHGNAKSMVMFGAKFG